MGYCLSTCTCCKFESYVCTLHKCTNGCNVYFFQPNTDLSSYIESGFYVQCYKMDNAVHELELFWIVSAVVSMQNAEVNNCVVHGLSAENRLFLKKLEVVYFPKKALSCIRKCYKLSICVAVPSGCLRKWNLAGKLWPCMHDSLRLLISCSASLSCLSIQSPCSAAVA